MSWTIRTLNHRFFNNFLSPDNIWQILIPKSIDPSGYLHSLGVMAQNFGTRVLVETPDSGANVMNYNDNGANLGKI